MNINTGLATAIELWKEFEEVFVDDNDNTLSDFLHFPKDTDRFEIWEWFEDYFPEFSIQKVLLGEIK